MFLLDTCFFLVLSVKYYFDELRHQEVNVPITCPLFVKYFNLGKEKCNLDSYGSWQRLAVGSCGHGDAHSGSKRSISWPLDRAQEGLHSTHSVTCAEFPRGLSWSATLTPMPLTRRTCSDCQEKDRSWRDNIPRNSKHNGNQLPGHVFTTSYNLDYTSWFYTTTTAASLLVALWKPNPTYTLTRS